MVTGTVKYKMKIKETIVVEGKEDERRLKSLFDVDIIRTNGTHIGKDVLKQIAVAQKENGVIVFTDPDYPGEYIRRIINENIEGCKNAFLTSSSRKKNEVGVEHATKEQIEEALRNLLTYTEEKKSLTFADFIDLGLSGQANSLNKRIEVEDYYHLGHGSAKTLLKRLNAKEVTRQDLETTVYGK